MSIVSNLVFKTPYIFGGIMGLVPRGSYVILGLGSAVLYTSFVSRNVVNQAVTGYKNIVISLGCAKFAVGIYEAHQCPAKDRDCHKKSIFTVSEGLVDVLGGLLGEFSFGKIFDYVESQISGDVFN